jgi:hypothetical protein
MWLGPIKFGKCARCASIAMVRPDVRAEMTQRSSTSLIRSGEAKGSREQFANFVISNARCRIEDFERTDDAKSLDLVSRNI